VQLACKAAQRARDAGAMRALSAEMDASVDRVAKALEALAAAQKATKERVLRVQQQQKDAAAAGQEGKGERAGT
jgi:hypothetical protein